MVHTVFWHHKNRVKRYCQPIQADQSGEIARIYFAPLYVIRDGNQADCRPQTVDKAALGCKSQSHFSFIKCIAFKIEILYDFLFS